MKYHAAALFLFCISCAHMQQDINNTPDYMYSTPEDTAPQAESRTIDDWDADHIPAPSSAPVETPTFVSKPQKAEPEYVPQLPSRTIDAFYDSTEIIRSSTPAEIPTIILPPDLRHFIRVGLSIDKKSHTISSPHQITIQVLSNNKWKQKLNLMGSFSIHYSDGTIILKTKSHTHHLGKTLRIVTSHPNEPVTIDSKDRYRGSFEIRVQSHALILINEITIEQYLRGVLPYEMGSKKEFHFEALKAQAVAARTYTYKHLNSRNSYSFDLFADVRDQVYRGVIAEYPLSDSAIQETKGVVMTYDNRLIDAYYHSTCGGETANIHEVWPNSEKIPYLVAMNDLDHNGDPWCAQSSFINWSVSWNRSKLAKLCNANLKKLNPRADAFSTLDQLEINGHTSCGRVSSLNITTDAGVFSVSSDKSRWLLRNPDTGGILMSSKYTLHKNGSVYTAKGTGFGHGIGLCQMGAMSRSAAGQPYTQILTSYYKDTQLVRYK